MNVLHGKISKYRRTSNLTELIKDGALVLDKKSKTTLLDNQTMLSVNQITAQIKLKEI